MKKADTGQCLDECPSTDMINKNKECVGEYNKGTKMSYICCGIVRNTLFYLGLDLVVVKKHAWLNDLKGRDDP